MRTNYAAWIVLFIIAALVTLATKYYPYFPGDVAVERWVQSLAPTNLNWAEGVSRAAEFPWILFILALIVALSWVLAGWRAALPPSSAWWGWGSWAPGSARSLPGRGLPRNWCASFERLRAPLPLHSLP